MQAPNTSFEFVSVVPTKDGRTKPNRQALVRKNAARYQWRNSKAAKASAEKTVDRTAGQIVVEKDKLGVLRQAQVTGPAYASHVPRPALQTYYLAFANDGKVAKIMKFCKCMHVDNAFRAH